MATFPRDLSPNRGLGLASSLAQAVQTGLSAYQQRQTANQNLAIRMAEIQSERELRRLQMQKLQQEIAPVEFSAAKWNVIDKAFGAGLIPEKVRTDAAKEVLEQANTPAKLNALSKMIDQKQASKLRSMSPSAFREQFGDSVVQEEVPEQLPQEVKQPPVAQAPEAQQPFNVTLTPKEAEFYGNLAKAKYGNQVQLAGINQRSEAALLNFQAQMEGIAQRALSAQSETDRKAAFDDFLRFFKVYEANQKADTATTVQGMKNEGAKAVANTRADATRDAARIRGSNKGSKAAQDPVVKSLLDQRKETLKAINKEMGTKSGFDMTTPRQKREAVAALQAQLGQLDAQLKAKGVVIPEVGGQAPSQAANVVPQGNPRPKFTRGPGVKAEIAKLPDGAEFEVDGQIFVKQGNQAIPR